jgi:hypothetical protein
MLSPQHFLHLPLEIIADGLGLNLANRAADCLRQE